MKKENIQINMKELLKQKVKKLKSSFGELKNDLIKSKNQKTNIKENYDKYIKDYKSKFISCLENEEKKNYINKSIHSFEYWNLINNIKDIEKFTKNLGDIVLNSLDNYNLFLMNTIPYYKQSASKFMINESQKLGYNFIFSKLTKDQIELIFDRIKNPNLKSFINRKYPSTIRLDKEEQLEDDMSSLDILSQYQLDKIEFNKFNESKFSTVFSEDTYYETPNSKASEILFENSELTNVNFSFISKNVNHLKIIDSKISPYIFDKPHFDNLELLTLDNDNLDSYSFQYILKIILNNCHQIYNNLKSLSVKNNYISKLLTNEDIEKLIKENKELKSLETLDLSNNNIYDINFDFFKLIPKLKLLDLYNNSLVSKKRCKRLMNINSFIVILGRNLGIMENKINKEYTDYYFKKLTSNEYPISSINMDSLYINTEIDKLFNTIHSKLKRCPNILEINLSSCNMKDEDMISILNKCLVINNNITKLNISYNLLTEKIFDLLVENNINIILHKLNVLDLSYNNINFIFNKNKDANNKQEDVQLIKFIKNFKRIEKLYLKGTSIEEYINEFIRKEVNNKQAEKKKMGGIMKFNEFDTKMKNIIINNALKINDKFKIYINDLVTAKYTAKKRLKDIPNFEQQIIIENQREEVKK